MATFPSNRDKNKNTGGRRQMKHVPQLDGLRAIAVLLVLLTHLWGYPPGYDLLNRVAAAGWMGVDLFFVLSGYLITRILWGTRDDQRYFLNFYMRRALRIFPIYYVLLAVVFIALPMFKPLPAELANEGWMYWLYLGNFALAVGGWQLFLVDITWSLSVEEQFYLAWPALIRRLTPESMMQFCVVVIGLSPFLRILFWDDEHWMWIHMLTPLRADAFAVGGLIAIMQLQNIKFPARAVFAVCAPMVAALVLTGNFKRESMLVGTIGYSLTAVTAGAAVVLATQTRALAAQPLTYIGKVSYGVYLYHPLCLMVMSSVLAMVGVKSKTLVGSFTSLIVTSATAVAAASASFYLVETRLLALKRFFASGSEGRPEPGATTSR